VAVVSEVGYGRAKFTGGLTRFTAVDPATVERVVDLGMKSGRAADLTVDGVLVHQKKAKAHHWKVGDLVPAEFAQTGKQDLRIKGIFSKRGFDGDYLISLQGHRRAQPEMLDGVAFVKVEPGAEVKTVQSRISAALAGYPDTRVLDQRQFEKVTGAFVDKLVALITVLLMLAVIIALLGIINTLALAVFERTRELGLLRAVGMTRNQVRAMVRWESVVISVFGAGVGAVLGTGLGITLTRALRDQGIESIAIPAGRLSLYVGLAAVAGVLAAIGPARRAAKVDVLRAVVTE
jgi:putative ABC transport system permease protein